MRSNSWLVNFPSGMITPQLLVFSVTPYQDKNKTSLGSLRSYYGDAEENVDQKINLYFSYESRDTLNSFCLFITVKAITKLNLGHRNKFEIEFQKINRRRSRSLHNAEFGHFTLLFCRGRQRNVQRVITHVHSYCSAH